MGAGLRPKAKAADEPPDPTVRAPALDPTGGGWTEKGAVGLPAAGGPHEPRHKPYLAGHLPYAFSGSDGAVVLKKKHTSRLDPAQVVPPAIESYLEKAGAFRLDIERMRDFSLSDERAKHLIYDVFTRHHAVLPVRLLPHVHRLYFEDDEQRARFGDRSLWSLNNAFTESVKRLREVPQQRCGIQIGRYFGRVLHAGSGGSMVAIPADVGPVAGPFETEFLLD
jgi:hypothetical protein